jgi:hypothetical protein
MMMGNSIGIAHRLPLPSRAQLAAHKKALSTTKARDIQVFKQLTLRGDNLSESNITRLHISWQTLMEEYSLRLLTKWQDKLILVDGLK